MPNQAIQAHTATPRPDGTPPPGPYNKAMGRFASRLYAWAAGIRNGWYDVNPGKRADRPVVSVGNLSAGGTGKTPAVVHIATLLKDAGRRPAIAMRGYKSATGNPADSDEAQQYQRLLPGVPLAVGADRLAEIKVLLTTSKGSAADCIILDDGFQHRQLRRDCDLVLVDATRNPFLDRQLPAGWLRESPTGLHRADGVIVTHAEAVSPSVVAELSRQIEAASGKPVLAICRHAWTSILSGEGQSLRTLPSTFLKGRKVAVACAIGNPDAFIAQVASQAEIVHKLVLPDHDQFSGQTVEALRAAAKAAGADCIVVTEKDWSKLRDKPAEFWPCPVVRPRLALAFDRGARELEDLVVSRVKAWKRSGAAGS